MQTLNYRPDIDGLRAVAVLAVIFYHANSSWLPGGFVGVDIFFVISGFLITAIINAEIGGQSFSFSQFYLRRIKRILPLFFTVIIATFLAGYFLLAPHEYVDLGKSARYAISFMGNHYFAAQQDYFAPEAEEMPLLHMWSLAVEEQYYFLWPSLLLLIRKRWTRHIITLPVILALGSFALATYQAMQPELASTAYYLLPSRLGELMIGSILAIYGRPCANRYAASASSWAGFALIMAACIFLDQDSVFPGYNALWPCLGAACIIYAGTYSQAPVINRILSSRAAVFIGLLSYSLYLWHWPVLAFTRYYTSSTELPVAWITACLLLTVILSWLSWRFIETPIRKQKINFKAALKRILVYPAIALLLFCTLIKATGGQLFSDNSLGLYTIDSPSLACHNDFKSDCHAGAKNLPAKVLIVGDSHTAHITTFFDLLGQQQGWAADILSVDSCAPLSQTSLQSLTNTKQRNRCKKLLNYMQAEADRYNTIIYPLRWDLHFGYNTLNTNVSAVNFRSQLENDIRHFTGQNKKIFLVSQVPLYKKNPGRLYRTSGYENTLDPAYEQANAVLKDIDAQYENVYYIDTATIAAGWKNGMVNGLPAYKDENHLNVYGQKMLLEHSQDFKWIQDILGKP